MTIFRSTVFILTTFQIDRHDADSPLSFKTGY